MGCTAKQGCEFFYDLPAVSTMNANVRPDTPSNSHPLSSPLAAGVASWVVISLGFLGLKMLMQERPEFVGPPIRTAKAVLVQESPRIVTRKVSDDVSVIKSTQPESSDIRFEMRGRRDYRGLKTISDMSGQLTARYVLTNGADEPVFVLFKCPHPRTESSDGQNLLAGGLKLQASVPGVQENAKDAWLWSGTVPARASISVEVAYEVASLKGVMYRVVEQSGSPLNQVRVAFNRKNLDSMRFENSDGTIGETAEPLVWERKNFLGPDFFSASIVEGRNLFTALSQLVEMGPIISLLFLVAVLAVIQARQVLSAVQMFTISAGYALYFPLVLYLSSRFSFGVALAIAVVVPGALLLNYARWLIGKAGLVGGPIFLALYQVFPTLAAFAGWNRGMVLLCLGVVTLAVLINLQNRALRSKAAVAALLLASAFPPGASAAAVHVLLPAELTNQMLLAGPEKTAALLGYEPAQYHARHEATHFQVEARLPFEVVRPGEVPAVLLAVPAYLQEYRLESSASNLVQLVTVTNRLGLYAQCAGKGTLSLVYRVPVGNREGKKRAEIPLFVGPPGNLRVESARSDFEILGGSVWSRSAADKMTVYDIGVAGEESVAIEWVEQGGDARFGAAREVTSTLYGIGLSRAQHLTVINSDGSCTHFAEFELPAIQKEEFRLRLPGSAQLISASVNGTEIRTPVVEDQLLCRVPLPARAPEQTAHRLSFRLAYPPVRLGFVGSVELTLPEVFQTAGTLEWVVSLPDGFETQVISSGLETQKTAADLTVFGDYGSVLKSHPYTRLAKTLAPPGKTSANFKFRQVVPGIQGPRQE